MTMATINQSLEELLTLDGALCAALVDSNSGMMLGSAGMGLDLEAASAGNTEVVRSKLKTINLLKLNDHIEDILITLGRQYHLIRPLSNKPEIFIYYVLDKKKSNLALARLKIAEADGGISF